MINVDGLFGIFVQNIVIKMQGERGSLLELQRYHRVIDINKRRITSKSQIAEDLIPEERSSDEGSLLQCAYYVGTLVFRINGSVITLVSSK